MGSALWAGISGLNASSQELDVIANNLANVNTVGFKAGTTVFSDVLSQSISGGSSGTMQVGSGVQVSGVETQFGAGSFETTGNATDVAIDGDGFFMVNDKNNATFYTRAGSFHLDSNGVLVDPNGYKVQGQTVTGGAAGGPITDIDLQGVQSSPQVTTTVSLGANLNSATATGSQYNATQTLYDSLGATHTLNTTFTKTELAGSGYWALESSLDSTPATSISTNGLIFDDNGAVTGMYMGTMGGVTTSSLSSSASVPVPTGGVTAVAGGVTVDQPEIIDQNTNAGGMTLTYTGGTPGTWSFALPTDKGGYTNATVFDDPIIAGQVDISLDGSGTTYLHFTPTIPVSTVSGTVQFTLTDEAATNVGAVTAVHTKVTDNGTATAAIDRPALVTQTGTLKLTEDKVGGNWVFATPADKGGYTNATVTSAGLAGPITISLDGSGTTDVTLTLAGTWGTTDGDTAQFSLNTAATATAVLDRPGMVYQTGTLQLLRGANTWSIINNGGYANATVTSSGTAGPVTISLDGTGTTDLTLTPSAGNWVAGDTSTFTLTHTPLSVNDITLNYSGALNGGATIGNNGDIKWNVTGENALTITQYNTDSVTNAMNADGYASGQLKTLSIDTSGRISGFFTNGQTSDLSQIVLASFNDPEGLKKMGSNLFAETVTSGSSIRNTPGSAGMGTLTPNTLEMSNVDIASEFINMITAQKAYQANARVVTTQDTIMQELMNLKR